MQKTHPALISKQPFGLRTPEACWEISQACERKRARLVIVSFKSHAEGVRGVRQQALHPWLQSVAATRLKNFVLAD